MVLKEKLRQIDEWFLSVALRLRPAVVDGSLRGHDEKGGVCQLTTIQVVGS
jgi:hypothetical protein